VGGGSKPGKSACYKLQMLTAFWFHVLWPAILCSLEYDSSVYYKPAGFIFTVNVDPQDYNMKTHRRKSSKPYYKNAVGDPEGKASLARQA
jgi:hypothetical protein